MSEPAEPKDDLLWFHIARDLYSGLAAYAIVIALAFLRDFLFKNTRAFKQGPLRSRISPLRWYSAFQSHYRDTNFFYYVEFVRLASNTAVCVLYVIGTYRQNVPTYTTVVNRVLASLLSLDILSQVLAAESALSSVLTMYVFFDVFSFPSLIISSGPNAYLNFSFLRSIGAYGAYSRLEKRLFVQLFGSKRLIVKLAFQCVTLFFTLAAGIQLLEVPGDLLPTDFRDTWANFNDWNFFNSAYFVVVTLSTVGYGDFSPQTIQGRIYTIFIIIVGIVIFTSVIGEIVQQSTRGRGSGWFVKDANTRHVIVTGTPTLTDLVLFVSEFYTDANQSNNSAKVVVLVENPSWKDSEWFQYIARNQFLQSRLNYLIGSVRNSNDLQRARISTADAVFFLTSPSTGEDPSLQDSRTAMNILAVRNVRTDIPIFAQTLLQDSKLQTLVALKTPCSFPSGTYFRDTVMRKSASLPNFFEEVLRSEYESIPKAHRKQGRQCFEEILEHYREQQGQAKVHSHESGKIPDLQRSELVCLQAIHMALISGNIKVNGVGTLLSNMYLDVQTSKATGDDRAWLAEYSMGAECSLVYAIIPDSLQGAMVRDIAMELYFNGLILVAVSDPNAAEMLPILTTEAFLRSGHIGMFLTYHNRRYVAAALHLVGLRLKHDELRHPLDAPISSRDQLAEGISLDMEGLDVNGIKESPAAVASKHSQIQGSSVSAPVLPPLNSISELNGPERLSSSNDVLGGNLLDSPDSVLQLKCSDGYMPDKLSGHVIIAMDGEATLGNLPLFLKSLWYKDKRRCRQTGKKMTVVVIHSSFSDQYKSMFSTYERKSLFFVEGSPASSDSWRRARLKTAKAVATMADYTQPWYLTDARTIFTLLTLDVRTASDSDIFICSELLDEKSLEFLREPTHPRRRGAMLGDHESITQSHDPVILSKNGLPNGIGEVPVAEEGVAREGRVVTFKDTMAGRDGEVPTAANEVPQNDEGNHDVNNAKNFAPLNPIMGMVAAVKDKSPGEASKPGLMEGLKLPQLPASSKKPGSAKSVDAIPTLGDQHIFGNAEPLVIDPAERPGAARARRGTLFSRSRYASGELLVHSSAITLLAREYVEPGFAKFFSNLLGTEPSTPGLKIRLVRIPKAMFDSEKAVTRKDGQRLIPYVEVFKALAMHGVTALGIYRSGKAPALIPSKSRRKRGHVLMNELTTYLQQEGTGKRHEHIVSLGMFGSLVQAVGDVAPNRVKEAQGRTEVRGGHGRSSESSEDSDEDFEDSVNSGDDGMQVLTSETQAMGDRETPKRIVSPRRAEFFKKFVSNTDEAYQVPGPTKYKERPVLYNLLPYVYTLPDPNTLCAEADAIYILCHPGINLSATWLESTEEGNSTKT